MIAKSRIAKEQQPIYRLVYMSNPVLSIVVPVYNVGNFLDDCIESVVKQDLNGRSVSDSVEVILVDDGSTDNSADLCDKWAATYPWIKSLHKSNGGVSSAKNYGIRAASGEYLQFLDADDELLPSCLDAVLSCINDSSPDVVVIPFLFLSEDGSDIRIAEKCSSYETFGCLSRNEALKEMFEERLLCYSWSFIVRRCYFDAGIQFPDGRLLEDISTTYRFLLKASRVEVIQKPQYLYRTRGGSICATRSELLYKSGLEFVSELLDEFIGTGMEVQAKRWCLLYLYKWECSLVSGVASVDGANALLLKKQCESYISKLEAELAKDGIGRKVRIRRLILRLIRLMPSKLAALLYAKRDEWR